MSVNTIVAKKFCDVGVPQSLDVDVIVRRSLSAFLFLSVLLLAIGRPDFLTAIFSASDTLLVYFHFFV